MSTFNDVIQNYSNGATGTVQTPDGQSVGYTVSGNVRTRSWGAGTKGAQVGQANGHVEVQFDHAVTNVAIFVTSANRGEEYVVSVDGAPVDLNDWIAEGKATYHALGGNQIVDAAGKLTSSGSWVHKHTAVLQFHVPVQAVGVAGDGSGGGWDLFDIGFAGTDLICFAAGSLIATPDGLCPVEALSPGDPVLTRDHGVLPVLWRGDRWCSSAEFRAFPNRRPVMIPKGVLGATEVLRVSRQHRLRLGAANGDVALVPAARLVDAGRAVVDPCLGAVRYLHLLLPCHAVVQANGVWCESLFWPGARRGLIPPKVQQAIRAATPDRGAEMDAMGPAHPLISRARDAARFVRTIPGAPAKSALGKAGQGMYQPRHRSPCESRGR